MRLEYKKMRCTAPSRTYALNVRNMHCESDQSRFCAIIKQAQSVCKSLAFSKRTIQQATRQTSQVENQITECINIHSLRSKHEQRCRHTTARVGATVVVLDAPVVVAAALAAKFAELVGCPKENGAILGVAVVVTDRVGDEIFMTFSESLCCTSIEAVIGLSFCPNENPPMTESAGFFCPKANKGTFDGAVELMLKIRLLKKLQISPIDIN